MKYENPTFKVIFIFIFIIISLNLVSSVTVVLNASKDTYLNGALAYKNYNYGAADYLYLDYSPSIKNILLFFNISSIPTEASITNAYISLYDSIGSTSDNITVYMVNKTWDEGTGDESITGDGATWNNATNLSSWSSPGGDINTTLIGSSLYAGASSRTNISVISAIQWWLSGLDNYGFLINASSDNRFMSRDYISPGNRPQLVVAYIFRIYPFFYNYVDNNGTIIHNGLGNFNISVNNTNGTVWLEINNVNITAQNLTSNVYNVSYNFLTNDTYLYKWWAYSNDSESTINYSSIQYYTVLNDIITPNLTIINPTATNYSYNSILVNISVLDNKEISRTWYNWNGTNITYSVPLNITFTQGSQTLYTWVNDTSNNINSTNVSFYIDSLAPTLTAVNPLQDSSHGSLTIISNITSFDSGIGLSSCWYKNDTDNINITVNCNELFNITQSSGTHYLYYWANDTFNNVANLTIRYQISIADPNINLIYPSNNIWLTYNNINFNFTAQDPTAGGIKNCSLFTNHTGSWIINKSNITAIAGGELIYYLMDINIPDGKYKWNVLCYESAGTNFNWALSNFSLNIDTIHPNISINAISTNTGSYDINVSVNSSDINLNYCNYTVYLGALPYLQSANSLSNCNAYHAFSISSFATIYNFSFNSIDLAGNTNTTSQTFSVAASSSSPGGGGALPSEPGKWILTTETGTQQYNLQLTSGASRKVNLVFENLGDTARSITLKCEGDLCEYFKFENSFNLPVQKDIKTNIPVTISLLKSVEDKNYITNIIAIDDLGNKNILTFNLNVGKFGFLTGFAVKILSSKSFGNINIPYFLILLSILLPVWLILSFLLSRQTWGSAASFIVASILSIAIIYII